MALGMACLFSALIPVQVAHAQQTSGAEKRRAVPADDRGVHGRKASEVAAEMRTNRRSAAAAEQGILAVADDPDAYVDADGRPFFADFADLATSDPIVNDLPVPSQTIDSPTTDKAFLLHSKPGSTHTVYLDFDGETVSNIAWTTSNGLTSKTVAPFDRDGSPTFNTAELQFVINTWQAVAEDYAPFDVDITTQLPSPSALSVDYPGDPTYGVTAVVTNDRWLCGAGCVGIAYVGVFDPSNSQATRQYYGTAWAFPTATMPPHALGQTISHEVGHNFGLNHDGLANPAVGYYSGHNTWSPIMGSAAYRQYTQWSKGEYTRADQTEDDIAIIASQTGWTDDPQGSTPAAAMLLPIVGTQTTSQTTIREQSDIDVYRIDNAVGDFTATVNVSPYSANLYPSVKLLDAGGTVVATALGNGAGSSLTYKIATPATYYVSVQSSGQLDPTTGFSTYGSIGVYTLSASFSGVPSPVTNVALAPTADGILTATWAAGAASSPDPVDFEIALCDASNVCAPPITTSDVKQDFFGLPAGTQFSVKVRSHNKISGLFSTPVVSPVISVLTKPTPPMPTKIRFDASTSTFSFEWLGAKPSPGAGPVVATLFSCSSAQAQSAFGGSLLPGGVLALAPATGIVSVTLPPSWANGTVEMKLWVRTNDPAPFDYAESITTVTIGRTDAPQAPANPPQSVSPTRPAAPQAPTGTSTPRGAAPQA
jgi:Metallo-peptidase family M12B Reprolysin-like